MNLKNVRLSIKYARNVFRYQPFKSAFPPTFGFPNNPWDNLDPNRLNKDLKDEYDKYY
jgi:hypothetical protein